MITHGMNIEQVRTLSSQLTAAGEQVQSTAAELTSMLEGTAWNGPDADTFRSDWQGSHHAVLQQVAEALMEAGSRAQQHAVEQEEVSSR